MEQDRRQKALAIAAAAIATGTAVAYAVQWYRQRSGAATSTGITSSVCAVPIPHVAEDPAEATARRCIAEGRPLPAFSEADLEAHRGEGADPSDIYVAVKGVVYRVTPQTYGLGAGYACFAGREVSRNLGRGIVEAGGEANAEWAGMTPEEHTQLDRWAGVFEKKYPVVGRFVPADPTAFAVRGAEFDRLAAEGAAAASKAAPAQAH